MNKCLHKKNLMATTALVLSFSLLPTYNSFSSAFDADLSGVMAEERRKGTKHRVVEEKDRVRTEYMPNGRAAPSSPEKAAEDAAETLRRQKAVEAELKRLQGEADAAKKTHRAEIDRLTTELREKEQRLGTAQRERDRTEEVLKLIKASQANLKEQYAELESKCRNLLTDKALADSMLTAKDGLLSRKRSELKALTDRLTQAGSDDEKLRQNILKAEAEVVRAQAAYDAQKAVADKVASDLAKAKEEREAASKKLAQLEEDRTAHEASLARLEGVLRGTQQESSELKAQMQTLRETMGESEQKILELQTRLTEGTDHLKRLTDYLQQMEGNYFQLGTGLEEALTAYRLDSLVNSMLSGLEASEQMHRRQRDLLKQELEESRRMNAHLQTEKAKSGEEIATLEAVVREKTALLKKMETQLAEKEQKNKALLEAKVQIEGQLQDAKAALAVEQRKHAETQAQLEKAHETCARLKAEIKEHELKSQAQADRYTALEKTLEALKAASKAEGASTAESHAAAIQALKAHMDEEASAWQKEKEALAQQHQKLSADYQTKMQEWDAQRAKLEEEIKIRSQKIYALEAQEDKNFAEIKLLTAQVAALDRERQSLEEDYQRSRTAYEEKVQAYDVLEGQLAAQTDSLRQQAEELAQAKREKAAVSAQLTAVLERQEALTAQLTEGQKAEANLEVEKQRLAGVLAHTEKELATLRAQHQADSAEASSAVQELQKNLETLRSDYSATTEAQTRQVQEIEDLHGQLSRAEADVLRLEGLRLEDGRTLQAEKETVDNLRAALEKARAHYSSMYAEAETQKGKLETARETLRQALDTQTAALKSKELAFIALQAQYDQILAEKAALEHQVHALKETLAEQHAETRAMEARAEEANAKLAKEAAARQQIEEAHAALKTAKHNLDEELVKLLSLISQQKESIEDAARDAADLRSTIESLREDIAECQGTISFLNEETGVYKQTQAQLEHDLQAAKNEYKTLEEKHTKALEQLDVLALEVQSVLPGNLIEPSPQLRNVLQRLSTYMETLKCEVELHRQARGEAEVKLEETENSLGALQSKLDTAQKQKFMTEQELEGLRAQLTDRERAFSKLDAEFNEQTLYLQGITTERDGMENEILALRGQVDKLKKQIEDLRRSKAEREELIAQLEAAQLKREQEFVAADRQLRRLTSAHDQSLEKLRSFQTDDDENQAVLHDMLKEIQTKEVRIHELDQACQETQTKLKTLEATIEKAAREGLKAVEAADCERNDKLNAQRDAEILRKKLEQMQREKESMQASIPELQGQIALQRTRLQDQQKTIDLLRTEHQQVVDELEKSKELLSELKMAKIHNERALITQKDRYEYIRIKLVETEVKLASAQQENETLESKERQNRLSLATLEKQAAESKREAEILRRAFSSRMTGTTEYRDAFVDSRRTSAVSGIDDSGLHTPTRSARHPGSITPGRASLQQNTGLTPAARAAMRYLEETGPATGRSGLSAVFAEMFAQVGNESELMAIQTALEEGYRLHMRRQSGRTPLAEQNGTSPYRSASTKKGRGFQIPPIKLNLG